jgi:hypothetical protein
VFTVSVALAEPLAGGVTGLATVQVAPDGHPETVKPTALWNPPTELTVMVEFFAWPCAIDKDDGLAESV